jgi:hypothetical protein
MARLSRTTKVEPRDRKPPGRAEAAAPGPQEPPATAVSVGSERGRKIKLPLSAERRLGLPYTFLTVVEEIIRLPAGLCRYAGKIYRPGALVPLEALPRPTIAIECAGPVGVYRRGRRHRSQALATACFSWQWNRLAAQRAAGLSRSTGSLNMRLNLVNIGFPAHTEISSARHVQVPSVSYEGPG